MKELGKSIMTALFLLVLLTALPGTVAYAQDTGKAVIKDYSAGNADLIEEVLESMIIDLLCDSSHTKCVPVSL